MHYVTTGLGNSLRFGARGRVHWSSLSRLQGHHASSSKKRSLPGQFLAYSSTVQELPVTDRQIARYSHHQSKDPSTMPTSTRRAEGAWRYEPPYVPPEKATSGEGKPFLKKVMGSCHCEMVQFWVTRDKPLTAKFCHCSDCKIIHGEYLQCFRNDSAPRTRLKTDNGKRCTFPMGCDRSQVRHCLHQGHRQSQLPQ
jgi:hypothetical protein